MGPKPGFSIAELFAGVPGQRFGDAVVDGAKVRALRFTVFAGGGGKGAMAKPVAVAGLAAPPTPFGLRSGPADLGFVAQHVGGVRGSEVFEPPKIAGGTPSSRSSSSSNSSSSSSSMSLPESFSPPGASRRREPGHCKSCRCGPLFRLLLGRRRDRPDQRRPVATGPAATMTGSGARRRHRLGLVDVDDAGVLALHLGQRHAGLALIFG